MAKFGGWSRFGGSAQFGGADARARTYYRILKDIAVPGAWPTDDEAIANKLLRADAVGLGDIGKLIVDQLNTEIFPHKAAQLVGEWEQLLGVVPPAGATLSQRRDAVVAAWRGAAPASLPAIREMLGPILRPATAFRDEFNDGYVGDWFDVDEGNGQILEASGKLEARAKATFQCGWDGENLGAPYAARNLHDRKDDFYVEAFVPSWSLAAGTGGGLVLFADRLNAVQLLLYSDGATEKLRVDVLVEGELYTNLGGAQVSAPDPEFWMHLSRVDGTWYARYGDDPNDLDQLLMFDVAVWPRAFGLFGKNSDPTWNLGQVYFDELRMRHGKQHNNVAIYELKLANIPAEAPEHKFFAFVHRDPDDPEPYDLKNAQRVLDRAKQAHTLILVGESKVARYDDPHTLYDRDVYGRP